MSNNKHAFVGRLDRVCEQCGLSDRDPIHDYTPQPAKSGKQNFFPDFTPEITEQRVKDHWDLSGAFPVPKFLMSCPVCGKHEILLKEVLFHTRNKTGSAKKFRCDVKFKCCYCSYVWAHGVIVPQEMAKKHSLNTNIHYRQLKRLQEGEQ